MQLSIEGLDLIKRSEGFRGQVYRDVAGLATIGYGHRVQACELFPSGLTEPEAAAILIADASEAQQAVERLVKVRLTQGQFDALTDFCFNLGAERLASSTLLRCLNAGGYEAAREQLLRWDRAAGHVVPGLQTRRQAEFDLWATAAQIAPTTVADAAA
jgi:lysozyme